MGIASRDLDNVLLLGKKENEDECSGIWKVSGWDHLRSTATGSANLAVNVPLRTLLAVAGRGGLLDIAAAVFAPSVREAVAGLAAVDTAAASPSGWYILTRAVPLSDKKGPSNADTHTRNKERGF